MPVDESASGERTTELSLGGRLKVGDEFIDLNLDLGGDAQVLTGRWVGENGVELGVVQLFRALRIGRPDIPSDFPLGLTSLSLEYHGRNTQLSIDGTSKAFGQVTALARRRKNGTWDHAVSFMAADPRPSKLPVVSMQARPFGLRLGGGLELDLGELTLAAQAGVAIDATQISGRFAIEAREPDGSPANMLEPIGIRGVTLSQFGMSVGIIFAPAGVTVGAQARFGLGSQAPGSNELAMVLQIVPAVPVPVVNILGEVPSG